ncbi:MAG TPA: hypothetical protein VK826_11825 [Bacteroidia bacterium]|nr:hypothetical protein [Bacteroidia bacterium]
MMTPFWLYKITGTAYYKTGFSVNVLTSGLNPLLSDAKGYVEKIPRFCNFFD